MSKLNTVCRQREREVELTSNWHSPVLELKPARKRQRPHRHPNPHAGGDDPDPEKEPDMPQQKSDSNQEEQEEEEDDGLDPAAAAKKAKQLARKGITFNAKNSPKVQSRWS